MMNDTSQHLPWTRNVLEEDLYQRPITGCVGLLIPLCFILHSSFIILRCIEPGLQLISELCLRESPSSRVAVLAPAMTWWHASNKPGCMRDKF